MQLLAFRFCWSICLHRGSAGTKSLEGPAEATPKHAHGGVHFHRLRWATPPRPNIPTACSRKSSSPPSTLPEDIIIWSSCFGKANAKNTLELLMRGTSCTPYPFPCLFGEYDCVGFWHTCLSWKGHKCESPISNIRWLVSVMVIPYHTQPTQVFWPRAPQVNLAHRSLYPHSFAPDLSHGGHALRCESDLKKLLLSRSCNTYETTWHEWFLIFPTWCGSVKCLAWLEEFKSCTLHFASFSLLCFWNAGQHLLPKARHIGMRGYMCSGRSMPYCIQRIICPLAHLSAIFMSQQNHEVMKCFPSALWLIYDCAKSCPCSTAGRL